MFPSGGVYMLWPAGSAASHKLALLCCVKKPHVPQSDFFPSLYRTSARSRRQDCVTPNLRCPTSGSHVAEIEPGLDSIERDSTRCGIGETWQFNQVASSDHLAYDASPCPSKRRGGVSCWRPPGTTRRRRVKPSLRSARPTGIRSTPTSAAEASTRKMRVI